MINNLTEKEMILWSIRSKLNKTSKLLELIGIFVVISFIFLLLLMFLSLSALNIYGLTIISFKYLFITVFMGLLFIISLVAIFMISMDNNFLSLVYRDVNNGSRLEEENKLRYITYYYANQK